jgi:hypothetical protein
MSLSLRRWIKRVSMLMLCFTLGSFVPRAEAMRAVPLEDPWLQPRLVGPLAAGWGEGRLYNCQILFTRKNVSFDDPLRLDQGTLAEFNHNVMFRTYADKGSEGAKVQIFKSVADPNLYVVSIAGSEGGVDFSPTYINNLIHANGASQAGVHSSYQNFVEQSLIDALLVDDPILPGNQPLIPPGSRIMLTGHSQGGNVSQNIGRVMEGMSIRRALSDVASQQQIQLARIVVAGSYIDFWSHYTKNLAGLGDFVYGMQEKTDPVPKLGVGAVPMLLRIGIPLGMTFFRMMFVAGFLGKFLLPWSMTTSSFSAFAFGLSSPILFTVGLFVSIALSAMFAAVTALLVMVPYLIRTAKSRNQITFRDYSGRIAIDAHSNSYNDLNQSDLWVALNSVGLGAAQALVYVGGYAPDCSLTPGGAPDMIPDDEWTDGSGCFTQIHNLCDPPPADPETVNPPQGQPDDYEAPWTTGDDNVSQSDLNGFIADYTLKQGSPAWKNEVKAGVQQRIAAAEAANQTQALEYFSLLEDTLESEEPLASPGFMDWTTEEHAAFETMLDRQMYLGDEHDFAQATGTLNGAPATSEAIGAHWQAAMDSDPIIQDWKATPAGQEYISTFDSAVATITEFDELIDDGGLEQLSTEIAGVERRVKTTGVGLLSGGLTNWADAPL